MAVYVNTVQGKPEWASLPAANIICYPLEERDYRPFAQAQFALSVDALYVQMIAFEIHPDTQSRLIWALGTEQTVVAVSFGCGIAVQTLGGISVIHKGAVRGMDLQGGYWGAQCAFKRTDLEACLGYALSPGGVLHANAYKTCKSLSGGRDHCGSLFVSRPVWEPDDVWQLTKDDFGILQIVEY